MTEQRIGIIDIGSNSVRLVVYEQTAGGANRVIDGSKRSARLSEQINDDGELPDQATDELIDMINHFRLICAHHRVGLIRAVATAAIRNAANREHAVRRIEAETSLTIEVLSGQEEASYGFLGMVNSLDVSAGFLIDIGGGSTEISLFQGRKLVHAVSFPFGCVSLSRRFGSKGSFDNGQLQALERHVEETARREPWLARHPHLPLIGIGGTVRALGKIHQAIAKYPFESFHNYPMSLHSVDSIYDLIRKEPLDKRSAIPGLSGDRIDIIVPGIAILRVLSALMRASGYVVCGSGLRDGLFFATRFPEHPKLDNVLAYSTGNLAALHPEAPRQHMAQVNRNALQLFDEMARTRTFPERARLMLDTASILYRIGASIDYYDYAKHTFYLMINSHIDGLSHRETLLCASIASYKSKKLVRRLTAPYRSLLSEEDIGLICRLGLLLKLAVALDRSETQSIGRLEAEEAGGRLTLRALHAEGSLTMERKEVDGLASDFKKQWGVAPVLYPNDYR